MRRRHADLIVRSLGMREGYLLLADISGYTAFLTGTELEHAHGITRELTTLLRDRLAPPMRFIKSEGDAVFCYADGESFDNGERLVELIETCCSRSRISCWTCSARRRARVPRAGRSGRST
jgi:hypothetical protein